MFLHVSDAPLAQIIPEGVPALYRELITRCWAYKPEERPTAEEILLKIIPKIKEQHCPELVVKPVRPQLGLERGRAQAPQQSSPSPGAVISVAVFCCLLCVVVFMCCLCVACMLELCAVRCALCVLCVVVCRVVCRELCRV